MAVEQTNGYKEAPVISDENFESYLMKYMNKSNLVEETPGYHYEIETDAVVFDANERTRGSEFDSSSGNSDSSNGATGGNVNTNTNTKVDFNDSGLINLLRSVNAFGFAKISVKDGKPKETPKETAKSKISKKEDKSNEGRID